MYFLCFFRCLKSILNGTIFIFSGHNTTFHLITAKMMLFIMHLLTQLFSSFLNVFTVQYFFFEYRYINYCTICNVIHVFINRMFTFFLGNPCVIAVQINEYYAQTSCNRENAHMGTHIFWYFSMIPCTKLSHWLVH